MGVMLVGSSSIVRGRRGRVNHGLARRQTTERSYPNIGVIRLIVFRRSS